MYHQEKVIDGVLHYKSTPDGEFKRYTDEQLTKMIDDLKAANHG